MLRVFCLLVGVLSLPAAEVAGKWSAKVPYRDAVVPVIFDFKLDGAKVSGTLTSDQGSADLVEGKLEGDAIAFVIQTDTRRYQVKGTIQGREIRFHARREGAETGVEFTATRTE
jgi:hypothetical protein